MMATMVKTRAVKGNHTQCKLKRGDRELTTWLPSRYAVRGKIIGLKMNGEWVEGYRVLETYSTRPSADVLAYRDQFRTHRDATDVRRSERGTGGDS